jgi:hypothetical protein
MCDRFAKPPVFADAGDTAGILAELAERVKETTVVSAIA